MEFYLGGSQLAHLRFKVNIPCSTAQISPAETTWSPGHVCLPSIKTCIRSSHHGPAETNLTRNPEVSGSIPGLAPWVKDPVLP